MLGPQDLFNPLIPSDNIAIVGCREQNLTVHSQQKRAEDIALRALGEGRITSRSSIAIIGAGFSGLTTAACLQRFGLESLRIDVFEKSSVLLPLQRNSHDRYLHPNIYNWPESQSAADSTKLLTLNWRAASASSVAQQVCSQFLQRYGQRVNVFLNHEIQGMSRLQNQGYRLVAGGEVINCDYDFVFICIGYGLESNIGEQNHSYWASSILTGATKIRGNRASIFVSGNGDGGLVDFGLAAFNALTQSDIYSLFLHSLADSKIHDLLLSIESRRNISGSVDIHTLYREIVFPIISNRSWKDIAEALRPNSHLHFHSRAQHLLIFSSSILNRIIACCAIEADRRFQRSGITVSIGKPFVGDIPIANSIHIEGSAPFIPHYRFLRLGADRKSVQAPFKDVFSRLLRRSSDTNLKEDVSHILSGNSTEQAERFLNSITVAHRRLTFECANKDGFPSDLISRRTGVWSTSGILWGASEFDDGNAQMAGIARGFFQSIETTSPSDLMLFSGPINNEALANLLMFLLRNLGILPSGARKYLKTVSECLLEQALPGFRWSFRRDMSIAAISATSYCVMALHEYSTAFSEEDVPSPTELRAALHTFAESQLCQDGLLSSLQASPSGHVGPSSVFLFCSARIGDLGALPQKIAARVFDDYCTDTAIAGTTFERFETINVFRNVLTNLAIFLSKVNSSDARLVRCLRDLSSQFGDDFFRLFGNQQIWPMRELLILAGSLKISQDDAEGVS